MIHFIIFTGLFDICGSDSEKVVNNCNVIAYPEKSSSNKHLFYISGSESEQLVNNHNVIVVDPDIACSNDMTHVFETEINGKYII